MFPLNDHEQTFLAVLLKPAINTTERVAAFLLQNVLFRAGDFDAIELHLFDSWLVWFLSSGYSNGQAISPNDLNFRLSITVRPLGLPTWILVPTEDRNAAPGECSSQ